MQVLGQKEKEHKDIRSVSLRLPELITKVAHELGITREALISKSRDAAVSEARAIISFLGTRKLGETQTEIQRHLNISRIGVRNCIIRCEKMTCAACPVKSVFIFNRGEILSSFRFITC
jgi:hypothetical protein